jgi:hypothetical protein
MEAMRNSWTDERLDDGFDRVTSEIGQVRTEVAQVRTEVGQLRAEVGQLRADMTVEFKAVRNEMHEGFAAMNRTLLQIGGGIIATLIGGIVAALLGFLITQL